jgi:transcriptional regulator with XRE-family HTH domain
MKKYDDMATKEFAARLEAALKTKNGGNQSEMARSIGCTPQAVNKWVKGMQFPRDRVLRKVAGYLNVTPEYLKFGSTPHTPPAPLPPPPMEWILMYVLLEEADLLTLYRELSETGRRQLRAAALHAERLPPEALPAKTRARHKS